MKYNQHRPTNAATQNIPRVSICSFNFGQILFISSLLFGSRYGYYNEYTRDLTLYEHKLQV